MADGVEDLPETQEEEVSIVFGLLLFGQFLVPALDGPPTHYLLSLLQRHNPQVFQANIYGCREKKMHPSPPLPSSAR